MVWLSSQNHTADFTNTNENPCKHRGFVRERNIGEMSCFVNIGELRVNIGELHVNIGKLHVNIGEFHVNIGEFYVNIGERILLELSFVSVAVVVKRIT